MITFRPSSVVHGMERRSPDEPEILPLQRDAPWTRQNSSESVGVSRSARPVDGRRTTPYDAAPGA
jgi:hypothetical protein